MPLLNSNCSNVSTLHTYINTHGIVSREAKKKQESELFTRNTAVKLVNALNKPPLKLSLSYQGLSTF